MLGTVRGMCGGCVTALSAQPADVSRPDIGRGLFMFLGLGAVDAAIEARHRLTEMASDSGDG